MQRRHGGGCALALWRPRLAQVDTAACAIRPITHVGKGHSCAAQVVVAVWRSLAQSGAVWCCLVLCNRGVNSSDLVTTPRPNSSPPLGEFNRPSSTSSLSNLHVLVHVTSAVCQSRKKGDRPLTTDQFCSFAVLQFCSGAAHPPALLLTPPHSSSLLAPPSFLA